MPDIFTRRQRSAVMAAIRSRGNRATELRLIARFREHGITGLRRAQSVCSRITPNRRTRAGGFRVFGGASGHPAPGHPAHSHGQAGQPALGGLKDPVGGMAVTERSPHHLEHQGKPVYFCSAGCQSRFSANPGDYLAQQKPAADTATPAPAPTPGTIYTCPMHPEIRQDHPGNCPICGMSLEPVMPGLDDDENPELADFTRRFWWTLPLTVVVTLLAMFGHRLGWFSMAVQSWIELVLALPIVLWAGWPFFVRGWQSLRTRNLNMFTLIAMGTGVSWVYSIIATLAPDIFPAAFRQMRALSLPARTWSARATRSKPWK